MGTSVTPAYRVEYRDQTGMHSACWKGQATATRLEDWRQMMNLSFQAGGSNEHLGKALGFVPHVSHAQLVHQKSGRVVVTTTMPMFEVV